MSLFFLTLYNLFAFVGLLIAIPVLCLVLPFKELKPRLGISNHDIKSSVESIWFHCASVGEVNAAKPLIESFKARFPLAKILVSTMTTTGYEVVKESKIAHYQILLPLDFYPLYRRIFKYYRPKMLIIVETELWFNLLWKAKNEGVQTSIVNGRISDKTYMQYRLLSLLFKPLFTSLRFTGAQSEEAAQRFRKLGFTNVHNTKNLKFCVTLPPINRSVKRVEWGYSKEDFIIVWGSSRPGEEKLLISIFHDLKRKIPNLRIIVAPRHLTRLNQIEQLLVSENFSIFSQKDTYSKDILIIDSIGILTQAYAIADIAIVGGSFYDFGGHNPLEPLFYGVATIIGNFHSSCRDIVKTISERGGIVISDRNLLANDILSLAQNRVRRASIAAIGEETLSNNRDSLELTMTFLIEKSVI